MRRFTRTYALTGALLVAAGTVFAEALPKLVVEDKIVDLGTVPEGAVKTAEFTLENQGEGTLEIRSVRPTCGCAVADFPKEVAPGGKGTVKVSLDTAGFKGGISKSVMVMSNDVENPIMTLALKADVRPYIEILPRPLVRFNVLQREDATEKVVVAGTDRSGDFKITGVKSDSDDLEISYRRLEEAERIEDKFPTQYEVAIRLKKDAKVGPVNSVVTVKTNAPDAKTVEIKVFGVIRALLKVTPANIQFGAIEARHEPSRNVIIVNNRPESTVTITAASIDDPAFTTEILPIEEGVRYQVIVGMARDAVTGLKDTTLVLKTTDSDFPELRIPVRAQVR